MVCSLKFSLVFWHSFSFIRKALIYHLFYFCVSTHKMREWNVFCFLFTYCHYFIRCTFLLPFPSFYYHYTLTLISPVDKQFTFPAETRFTFSQRRRHFDAIVVHRNMYSFLASSIRVVINCQFVTLFCLQVYFSKKWLKMVLVMIFCSALMLMVNWCQFVGPASRLLLLLLQKQINRQTYTAWSWVMCRRSRSVAQQWHFFFFSSELWHFFFPHWRLFHGK